MQNLTRLSSGSLLAALTLAAAPAWPLSLGDIEIRSALGETLDARVPLGLSPGEIVDATCFALARDPEPGVPVLTEGLLTVERGAGRTELRIRSSGSVFEPAIRVRVRAGCPGQAGEALRQYSVLLDPRRGDPVVANVPAITASLDARSGDTLEGIASKVFPRNRGARDQYLQSMREVNPALASLGNTDPIPAGANVLLPDLRTFTRSAGRAPSLAEAPRAETAKPAREKSARRKPRPERVKAARGEAPATPGAATPPVAAASTPRASRGPSPSQAAADKDFVLRLSSDSVDLSRTREVDERTRAQLRERLMILESDDQVAAVLALRNRLTQLEQRVNELQLKLAQMPAAFPERPAAPATPPAPVPAPAAEPAKPAPAAETPPTASAPATEPPRSEGVASEAAKAEPPKAEPAKTGTTAADASAPKAPPKPAARTAKPAPGFDLASLWQSYGLWAVFIAVLSLLMLLVWRLTHRPEPEYAEEAWDQPPPTEPRVGEVDDEACYEPQATQALAAPGAPELRRRYIEERFPEVVNGTLSLDDPTSVVKSARLLYEDGAVPRAAELLSFAIEENPGEARTWLALFEIYRLERMTAEFADLARRFFEHFGDTEYWRKIRYFGREIDPGNFLYREDVDAIETIAPGSAAGKAGERFDPARENWLGAPMDFDNQVLANELRQALMAASGIVEQDLVPNPMPALRDAEMFTVA